MRFPSFLLSMVLIVVSCTEIDNLRTGELRQSVVYESEAHAAFPSVARLTSGDLLCVFRQGSDHVSPDGKIFLSRSKDKGKTWVHEDTVVVATRDCRDPSIVQLKDGTVLLSFFQSEYDLEGELIGVVGCFIVRSFDQGYTFTAPRMIPMNGLDWSATSDEIVELENGVLALPVYGGMRNGLSMAWIVFSRDGGETWSEPIKVADGTEGHIHFLKPALIQLPDSRLYCMMRTDNADGFLYESSSDDGGETWSAARQTNIQGQAPDLFLTDEGTVICAYRDFWPRGVSTVSSYDWGQTWEKEMQLFGARDDCAYPSMVAVDTWILAVHYEVTDGSPRSKIRTTKFDVHPPSTPEGFVTSIDGKGQVQLRWNVVEGARYYMVYRDTVDQFTPMQGYPFAGNGIATPTNNSYMDYLPDANLPYYYRISAVAGAGRLISGTGNESIPTEAVRVSRDE